MCMSIRIDCTAAGERIEKENKKTMTNEEYTAYIQSDKWKAIAKKRMEIDQHRCCMCGCRGTVLNPLNVHHLSYKSLGHEENRVYQDLVTLCFCCHKATHNLMDRQTDPNGRHGWKDSPHIPQIHVFNINGSIEHKEVKV